MVMERERLEAVGLGSRSSRIHLSQAVRPIQPIQALPQRGSASKANSTLLTCSNMFYLQVSICSCITLPLESVLEPRTAVLNLTTGIALYPNEMRREEVKSQDLGKIWIDHFKNSQLVSWLLKVRNYIYHISPTTMNVNSMCGWTSTNQWERKNHHMTHVHR